MKLKVIVIKNKANNQLNFSLPRKKLTKKMLKKIDKNKYLDMEIFKKW